MLSGKQSIQEVTHESPPHNSHVATLKLRGPPNLPWKVYKHCVRESRDNKGQSHGRWHFVVNAVVNTRFLLPLWLKSSIISVNYLFTHFFFLNRLWSPQWKILPSSHSALQWLSTVSYFTQAWIPKAQIFTHMTRLTSSIERANVACARYLAGRGFVGRLQLLWQLTGAVAGCVTETQRTMNEIHYPVTELLLAFIHCCSNGLVKCQDFKIAHTSTIQSLVERF